MKDSALRGLARRRSLAPAYQPFPDRVGELVFVIDSSFPLARCPPASPTRLACHFGQENAGAWQLCFDSGDGEITLYAHQETWCMADDSGYAELRSCNGNYDQSWYGPTVSGSFKVHNINGGVLCADGGVTYIDVVVASSSCSSYHQSWAFETSP